MGLEWAGFHGPYGRGWVARRGGTLVALHLAGRPPSGARRVTLPIARKIERYFAGDRVAFDERIELPPASAFARRVYGAVRAIPRGETRTYGQIARAAGRPGAARAVGSLMRRNPICLVVP